MAFTYNLNLLSTHVRSCVKDGTLQCKSYHASNIAKHFARKLSLLRRKWFFPREATERLLHVVNTSISYILMSKPGRHWHLADQPAQQNLQR